MLIHRINTALDRNHISVSSQSFDAYVTVFSGYIHTGSDTQTHTYERVYLTVISCKRVRLLSRIRARRPLVRACVYV